MTWEKQPLGTGNKARDESVWVLSYFPEFLDVSPGQAGLAGLWFPNGTAKCGRRTDLGMTDWASKKASRRDPCLPRSLFVKNIGPSGPLALTECNVHRPTLGKWAGHGPLGTAEWIETKIPDQARTKIERRSLGSIIVDFTSAADQTCSAPSTVHEPMQALGKFFQVVLWSFALADARFCCCQERARRNPQPTAGRGAGGKLARQRH